MRHCEEGISDAWKGILALLNPKISRNIPHLNASQTGNNVFFFFFLQVGLLEISERGNGDENKQQCTVHISHSPSSVFMWQVWAIKVGFTHLKLPCLGGKVYRRGFGALARWLSAQSARPGPREQIVSPSVLVRLSGDVKWDSLHSSQYQEL